MQRQATVVIGGKAEQVAAEYLTARGYAIHERNWRRRECEIDIIALKDSVAHLVEVKYRSTGVAGEGLEYIGPRKLRQMEYACRRWVAESRWQGSFVLSAIEVSGESYMVTAFIECIY